MSLIWTIAPLERVLEGQEEAGKDFREIRLGGISMIVSPVGDGLGRVERIISPIPADYLRPEWQPGRLVPLYQADFARLDRPL